MKHNIYLIVLILFLNEELGLTLPEQDSSLSNRIFSSFYSDLTRDKIRYELQLEIFVPRFSKKADMDFHY